MLRTSIGFGIRDIVDEHFASFEERFSIDSDPAKIGGAKKTSTTGADYGRLRLASLEMPVDSKALSDAATVLAISVGDRIPPGKRSDSFAERFAGERDRTNSAQLMSPPEVSWVVQLIGDSSEPTALSRFRELQNRRKSILGTYNPLVISTTFRSGSQPIWTRIRVGLSSRQAAESLCAQLEVAGERCWVQRNANS